MAVSKTHISKARCGAPIFGRLVGLLLLGHKLSELGGSADGGEGLVLKDLLAVSEAFIERLAEILDGFLILAGLGEEFSEAIVLLGAVVGGQRLVDEQRRG